MMNVIRPCGEILLDFKPHVFYFNRDHIDQNIIDTGHEFYKEGFLEFPFDQCIFIFDNAIENADNARNFMTKNMREGYIIRNISSVENPILKKNIEKSLGKNNEFTTKYFFQKFTEMNTPALGVVPIPDPVVAFLSDKDSHREFGGVALQSFVPEEYISTSDTKLLQYNYKMSIGTIIGAMMLLNTKYAHKKENLIDERLNNRRRKNGKPPLHGYTTITLGGERNKNIGDKTGTHARPKPHWRRGHIRRLHDRVTKVMPCIVNWDGQDVSENLYKVAT